MRKYKRQSAEKNITATAESLSENIEQHQMLNGEDKDDSDD